MKVEAMEKRLKRYIKGGTLFYFDAFLYNHRSKKEVNPSVEKNLEDVILFDTSIYTMNQGDSIIMEHCVKELKKVGVNIVRNIPTHISPVLEDNYWLEQSQLKFLLGTNIISPWLNISTIWEKPENLKYTENLCLFGCGMLNYLRKFNSYSKWFYTKMLQNGIFHSVRDSETEKRLKAIGIENVLNTSCPTMWGISEEHCKKIPTEKSDNVITAITDYNKNPKKDTYLINTLGSMYGNVYVWLQGLNDLEYVKTLSLPHNVIFINTLEQYHDILKRDNLEYIGTRLHAGIEAINYGLRSLIISVDDRSRKIAQDTNLPIIERDNLTLELCDMINKKRVTNIHLPFKNIELWQDSLKQFIR